MRFIPTTATAADKLKRGAKEQRKKTGVSLGVALDDMARASGYESWKHVTSCVEQTPASREALGPLPDVLARFLEAIARTMPPSETSKQVFAGGLAFALDVKDAEGGLDDDIVFCDDAWPIAGVDLLRVFAHEKEHEDDLSLAERLAEEPDSSELPYEIEDELMNWRLLRYTGPRVFATLDEAFAGVLGGFYFPPSYVWLGGRFFNVRKVPEVRVGGKAVYTTSPTKDGGRICAYALPGRDGKG